MALITRDRSEQSDIPVGDRDVKTTVVHRLRENPYTQDAHIGVEVHDGVVHLTGEVHTAEEREVATEDVQTVPGVTEVQDSLTIAA